MKFSPVIITNQDIKNTFDTTIVYDVLTTNGIILFKNQKLSVQDQETILNNYFLLNPQYQLNLDNISHMYVSGSKLLLRVTAKHNENNKPGAFCNYEGLPWHSDNPTTSKDRLLTWLYGAENTNGSETIYCNTDLAFNELPTELKALAKTLIAYTTNRFIYQTDSDYQLPLYTDCGQNRQCWSFPFTQIKYFEGYTVEESKNIIETLKEYVLQDQYCYAHKWEDGDLIISNEKITIHKRPAYDKMDQRVLHKGTMGLLHIV